MRILYIFPHPDDESFGPAHVMSHQRRRHHEVFLLTLTKGGATKQRHKWSYSVEEMGAVRFQEMQQVAKVLDLSGLKVLDLPDGGLKEMDPREIERVVIEEINRLCPAVVVSYAVHGISGFHDHLVTHAVVKRVFCELRDTECSLKRCALFTIKEEEAQNPLFRLSGSTEAEIDCICQVEAVDIQRSHAALDCYQTFKETIERSKIKEHISQQAVFELFQEEHTPPLGSLFEGL